MSERQEPRGEAAREALERAVGTSEPDVSRLLAAVPHLMVEADRQRRPVRPAPFTPLALDARRAVPGLALATTLAVVVASAVLLVDRFAPAARATTLDKAILGETGDDAGEIVLDAVLGTGEDDG